MLTDGKLAGRVTNAKGKLASHVKVSIIPIFPVRPQFSVVADEEGHFEVTGRQPGSYIVGIGLLAQYNSREWKTRVYYPGVRTREEAKTIVLGDGEWRTDIDFQALTESSRPVTVVSKAMSQARAISSPFQAKPSQGCRTVATPADSSIHGI